MLLISQQSNPIIFEEVPNPPRKNIIVFGMTGSGKSTLLNKLRVAIKGEHEYKEFFEAKKVNSGVTQKLSTVEVEGEYYGKFRLIDTVGFDDVDRQDTENWGNFV